MTEATARPLRRRVQARVMRIINVPMRFVLGLPFATPLSGRLMLVFLTGRRTGRSYRQPVSYVRDGTTLLTPGGGRWKLNLQDGRPGRIRIRGHDVWASPKLIADLGEIDRLLRVMIAANPRVRSFVGIPIGSDGRLSRPDLETAVEHGFRIVRWRLDESKASVARSERGPKDGRNVCTRREHCTNGFWSSTSSPRWRGSEDS